MNTVKLTLVVALTSALIACGGGGSSGSTPSSSSSNLPISSSSSSSDASSAVSSISSSVDTSSNSSSNNSSTGNSSSSGSGSGGVREAKMEGFAAYHNVTGGQGGPVYIVSTGTELNQALCGSRNGNRAAPVVILVNGTINHGNTTAQGCDTHASVIEIKKTSNISIIGVGNNALFDQIGIHVREASNIIIQNVHIRNVKKSGSPISNGGDAIGMETNVDRVWIDHNWLEASGGEKDGYDSLLDMKAGVTNVTVSYNLFNDSSRGGLIGSSDSDNKNNNITFHHNWYKNIEQRTPLIRHATVHMYNNYWSNENRAAMIHGINSRMTASALVESNYFQNVNNPLLASKDSSQAGCWQTNNDNTLIDYIYTRTVANGQAHAIPEIVDGQMQSTCAVSVPYTVEMDAAADVPGIVTANAGVGKIEVDTEGAITPPGGGGSASSGSSSSAGGGETIAGDWNASPMIMSGGHSATRGTVISSSEEHVVADFNGGKIESSKKGFFYVHKVVGGDFVFTANLVSVTAQTRNGSQGQVGILMCTACENGASTLSASAKIGVTGNDSWGIVGEHRLDGATRNGHSQVSPSVVMDGDLYFRIVRSGDTYTSYYSIDGGETWEQKNTGTFSAELPDDVQIGVYGSNGHDSANGFIFENITLLPLEEG